LFGRSQTSRYCFRALIQMRAELVCVARLYRSFRVEDHHKTLGYGSESRRLLNPYQSGLPQAWHCLGFEAYPG